MTVIFLKNSISSDRISFPFKKIIIITSIDHFPNGAFQGQYKQIEKNIINKQMFKKSQLTGDRPVG